MKRSISWWTESGHLLVRHPELLTAARGICGFGGGARWMHRAMAITGWRMPPFRGNAGYFRMGWVKYGVCGILALLAAVVLCTGGLMWFAPLVAVAVFYATEAQMVFLFPEALLGRRSPWASARALTFSAGGTWKVMAGVLPIATGMLTGWRHGRSREAWLQGCLAVVLWHREVALSRPAWVENPASLPPLEIGPVAPLLVRRETLKSGVPGTFRVLWISDLHWRGAGDRATLLAIRGIVQKEKPDICILGGDFVERPHALPLLKLLVRSIVRTSPCVALPGNHDLGRFSDAVPNAIRKAGGHWLPDTGRFDFANADGGRLEIVTRDAPRPSPSISRIVAVHDPAELDDSPPGEGTIVLAGHLHGGQWVISAKGGRLLPAAWFYQHAWLRRNHAGAEWIVSRGAGDTLPMRWNCPREVILCEIS